MDRGVWEVTVHGVTKSWTGLSSWALTRFLRLVPVTMRSTQGNSDVLKNQPVTCPRPFNKPKLRLWLCHNPAMFVNNCRWGSDLSKGMSTEHMQGWGLLASYKSVGPGEVSWPSSSHSGAGLSAPDWITHCTNILLSYIICSKCNTEI